MPEASLATSSSASNLRLWPAVTLIVLLWIGIVAPPLFLTFGTEMILAIVGGVMGPMALYLLWWLLFSRVPWKDRLLGLLLLFGGLALGVALLFHPTAANTNGLAIPTILLPAALTAVTIGFVLTENLTWKESRLAGAVMLVLVLLGWCAVRVEGSDGGLAIHLAWRWNPSAEQQFLAEREAQRRDASEQPAEKPQEAPAPDQAIALQPGDWPGFRGPDRDSRLTGASFGTNWKPKPKELWRKRVGPGWSSFAVVDGRLYTQEQRGKHECVVCYQAEDGMEVWSNEVTVRFSTPESGPGPLATPTFFEGGLYTCGATGVVQRLDAAAGDVLWRRSLTEDLPIEKPHPWGFASSPLVINRSGRTLVIVYAGNPPRNSKDSTNDKAVVAYDAGSGDPVWTAGAGGHAYCSPMLATLNGVEQVLIASNDGLESLVPTTGERLWFYEWSTGEFPRIAIPIVTGDNTLVLATGYGYGAHGIRVTRQGDRWQTETLWQSRLLKPYFNDNVYFQGHVYGFDDKFLTCLDAETGELAWSKRTRRETQFGCGQVLLVADPGLLLVMTELTGEVVLLKADPSKPVELARMEVLEGKTWNHPVIAHGRLYVRNGEEMACFQLPTAGESTPEN